MGGGIAQVLAGAGIDVVIADADVESTQRNHERLLAEARDFEDRKLVDVGFADRVAKHLTWATSLEDAVREVDLIEEAVPEVPALKSDVLRRIEAAARPDAVIASNTSTLPIADLAANLSDASRFLGVHFSNPAPFIPGVELIAHAGTDESVIPAVEALVARTGKLTAAEMLNELVEAGRYGVKQGGGFVTEAGDQTALIAYRNTAYARLGQLLVSWALRLCDSPKVSPEQPLRRH